MALAMGGRCAWAWGVPGHASRQGSPRPWARGLGQAKQKQALSQDPARASASPSQAHSPRQTTPGLLRLGIMLDRLFDLLAGWLDALTPWTVVYAYEKGVRLRFGRFNQVLEPGWHWQVPLVDHVMTCTVVANTMRLMDQNLTTADGQDMAVSGIVTFRVTDPKIFLLDVEGGGEAIADTTYGAIAEWVSSNTRDIIRNPESWTKLESRIRRQAKEYGIDVIRFKFADQTRAKALRLLGGKS